MWTFGSGLLSVTIADKQLQFKKMAPKSDKWNFFTRDFPKSSDKIVITIIAHGSGDKVVAIDDIEINEGKCSEQLGSRILLTCPFMNRCE